MPEIQLPYFGPVSVAVLVFPLLYGPLAIWVILRLAGIIGRPREETRLHRRAQSTLLFWACDECHSVTPEPGDVCYYCGTRRQVPGRGGADSGQASTQAGPELGQPPSPEAAPVAPPVAAVRAAAAHPAQDATAGGLAPRPGPRRRTAGSRRPKAAPVEAEPGGRRTGPHVVAAGTSATKPPRPWPVGGGGHVPVLRVITPEGEAADAIAQADEIVTARRRGRRPAVTGAAAEPPSAMADEPSVGSPGSRRGRRVAG
ncbi:MAG: hypothetical protein EPN50_00835 [Chloroflexota bacterium]|nr:MAG: hypothetical protein EPN50_00835 [Chloroflexota bacterium]